MKENQNIICTETEDAMIVLKIIGSWPTAQYVNILNNNSQEVLAPTEISSTSASIFGVVAKTQAAYFGFQSVQSYSTKSSVTRDQACLKSES